MRIDRSAWFGAGCLLMLAWTCLASAESKVYLIDGETRLGYTTVRFGRVTVKAVDRLFQHPEEAVHRIEHVTGETTLIGREGILLREKPEKLSKTLIAIPKGCEVHVLDVEGEWVKIRAFAGKDEAIGYLHTDDLSDDVLFHFVNPTIRFQPPPTNLKDLVDREAIRRNMQMTGRLPAVPSEETSFSGAPEGDQETDFSEK
ncbi:MAG: SH3 domain-containing protein [Candidatus Omnitrophica bacterium]|nr:SH3 domain-containing protein [Candidatus Omnitrophota bacterium]MCA9414824.1 SH3 domain-containing protein [Candidatus Omnitrophota bacterium]MCA9423430.1 SH3 domain-containing protein [Candidatus Omnitrophota bacterium]MCA9429550.1 SH3 domain-containing protein [Candidatus Omnitrophota bacterium]MCA9434185.1 SH3 domain-containing protein [Candidatus Omnitrophota bacterium]